jgi:DNA-binding transcriptional LysR family regulator
MKHGILRFHKQDGHMSELDDIRAFVEVLDNGGFSRAARSLGISKSIVSRRIARLEDDLGTPLLHRTTRGITPTEAGIEFKLRGERILTELNEAREAMASQRGEIVGRLRITLPAYFGVRFITPILTELAMAHPRLEIDAVYTEHTIDMISERFDAAIRIGSLKDSTLVSRRIATIRRCVVASPAYLSRYPLPKSPDDIRDHEWLLYTGQRERKPLTFQSGRKRYSFLPTGRFRTDSGEALIHAAEAGMGITALPRFLCFDSLRAGRLVEVLTDFTMPEEGFYVVRPPGPHVPARVRRLIDLLVERFSDTQVWDLPITPAKRKK